MMAIRRKAAVLTVLALIAAGALATPALAQQCGGADGFGAWLQQLKQEAAAQGISAGTLSALDGVRFDQSVINADRRQGVFSQSFVEFAGRMVADYRMSQGRALLDKHASTFQRIEQQYGVPGPVIASFWGLETDFGANLGDFPTLQSLATLARDCRRPERFRAELMAALMLLDRGDLALSDMRGAWAGEVGQMQFIPTEYLATAVDYDGDGKRNLVRSVPDVLASSAALLQKHGWQAGQPWLEEVRVPDDMPWPEADLAIKHPRSAWASWGVTKRDGSPLPSDGMQASLLLPMGRLGPAFLAYPNFDVYTLWNESLVYASTAAYFATRLAGAPPVQRGNAEAPSREQIIEAQQRLQQLGYDVGGADGIIGANTRAAVKDVQMKLGMPADSYPDPGFLAALRQM
jgi:lytic murein transglycosylase